MSNGIASTKGHLASNGGLRGHSVGEHFPVVLSLIGTPDNLRQLVITPTGQVELPTYEMASALAGAWKQRRALRDELPSEPTYEYTGCLLNLLDDGSIEVWTGYPTDECDCVGVYVHDVYGLPVWIADVDDAAQAMTLIYKMKELPL